MLGAACAVMPDLDVVAFRLGLAVLRSELLWVWLPSLLVGGAALAWRGRNR